MGEGEGEKSTGMYNMYANIMLRNVEFLIPCTRLLLPSHLTPPAVLERVGGVPKSQRQPILAEMGIGGKSPLHLIPSAVIGIGDVPQPQQNALSAKRGVGGYLPSDPTRKGGEWKDMCVCNIMMHRIMKIYRKEFFMMYLGRM